MQILAIGCAGVIGAWLRYGLGLVVIGGWVAGFPLATWIANGIGSFVLGWWNTSRWAKALPESVRSSVGTGLIGSFTTFSTFSVETLQLLQNGRWAIAGLYLFLSFAGGLAMAWLGFRVGLGSRPAEKEGLT
ncbi:putative fluoride ion transporter CrcB 1 [Marinithermofilum abyssi]|uniref:Fluoride-specific ion channel FluC n=1 Tax=Marinithermofilum abyssi TaxID=1571185 RepID=A0A8J2YF00_9BACL|nr:CrcB family protein [Marinithermofilum abyssi]GGE27406.1 putative fluoride ion transporter CrcB 1 [Marinithermofilum abyssi]